MTKPAAPKLKVFATIWWGYSFALRHIPLAVRAGMPLCLAIFFLSHPLVVVATKEADSVLQTLPSWLAIPLCAHFAVAWHRSILLGDHSPRLIRFGKPELLYAAVTVLFRLPDIVPSIIDDYFQELPVFGALSLILYLVVTVTIILATPILPALAIGDHAMTVPTIWRQLRGNWVRFILIDTIIVASSLVIFISSVKVVFWVEKALWSVLEIDLEKATSFGTDFVLIALSGALSSAVLAVELVVILAASVGTLSIVYAGIVRRTLASQVDYIAVDRLAARLTAH